MGEKMRRLLSHKAMIATAKRCVYCSATTGLTCEHMPPIGMFKDRDRPRGWEFPCCARCNQGTRGADAVAQFFAKMEVIAEEGWKLPSNINLRGSIEKYAAGVMDELFEPTRWTNALIDKGGLLHRSKMTRADGPLVRHHMNIFSEKVAMAAFANIVGRPVDLHGLLLTEWFLNAGLSKERFEAIVSVMPGFDTLKQGKKNSGAQFRLRYNTDENSIVAGIFSFHSGLSIMVVSTDNHIFTDPITQTINALNPAERPTVNLSQPGLSVLD